MTEGAEAAESGTQVTREDISLSESEHGPVLEIGGFEIVLKTFLEGDEVRSFDSMGERIATEVDCDGEMGCWWSVFPDDDLEPMVTIQPEVAYQEDDLE